MKRRALSWFMAAALGVGTMAGGIGSANIVLAEEQKEETEAADGTSEEPADETDSDSSVMKIGALKGPTAMGMAQLLDDENYEFSLAASPDEIVPMIVQGQVDVAAVPSNLASVLYQKTDKNVSVLAVNTLGVLYLVENGDSIQSVDDLKGKTIYASGKGATPEYALNSVLKSNGLDPEKDVTIEYKSEHAEVVAALAEDQTAVGLLPQPFVTTALMKNENLRVALDLNELWESSATDGSRLVTGVVIARNDYLKEHEADIDAFMDAYKDSVEFVNSDTEAAAQIIGNHDIIPAEVAAKAIPECSIVFMEGDEMQTILSGYLNTLIRKQSEVSYQMRTSIINADKAKKYRIFYKIVAAAVWIMVWQLTSMYLKQEILLASPVSVIKRLTELIVMGDFWKSVVFSFVRIILGFSLALVLGTVLAALSSAFFAVEVLMEPLIMVIKATPVASFIILCLIWIPSRNLSVFISFLMVFPVVYTNILEGIRQTDKQLLEMADSFGAGVGKKLQFIYLSQVMPYAVTACKLGLGLCWKAGIAAEVIGIPAGSIGEKLYKAKVYLETPDLFAWTIVIIAVSVGFEKIFMFVLRRSMGE